MRYERIRKGKFLSRPNRFIAIVELDGKEEVCHVKNTGRCRELLIPGATVFVQESDNPERKTKFDLIAVYKGSRLINMDSQIPNRVFAEWVKAGNMFQNVTFLRPESTYQNSRFDFYIEADGRKVFVEVKGVTLEDNGVCRFPDAPTARGVKHVKELISCAKEGYLAYIVFVIQMKHVSLFMPNDETDPAFGAALREAERAGVRILALDCLVTENEIRIDEVVPVRL